MTTFTTPATDALNHMYTLQTKLAAQTCPHCHHNSLVYINARSCHCTNLDCGGWMATMPEAEFKALTADQLASYQRGRTQRTVYDPNQLQYGDPAEAVVAAKEARELARDPQAKLFG